MTPLVGSREAARDVVQEAFAQALRDRVQYRRDGSLEAWIWRIAFRTALRSRGGGRREFSVDELVTTAPTPVSSTDPTIVAALRRLPPRRRLMVFLRYFADLSYGDIATLCEVEEGTVAATLAHARADLLHEMRQEEVPQ